VSIAQIPEGGDTFPSCVLPIPSLTRTEPINQLAQPKAEVILLLQRGQGQQDEGSRQRSGTKME
jgi:hypothetical protein